MLSAFLLLTFCLFFTLSASTETTPSFVMQHFSPNSVLAELEAWENRSLPHTGTWHDMNHTLAHSNSMHHTLCLSPNYRICTTTLPHMYCTVLFFQANNSEALYLSERSLHSTYTAASMFNKCYQQQFRSNSPA